MANSAKESYYASVPSPPEFLKGRDPEILRDLKPILAMATAIYMVLQGFLTEFENVIAKV